MVTKSKPPRLYEEDTTQRAPRGKDSRANEALLRGFLSGYRGRFANPDYVAGLYSGGESEAIVKVIGYSRGYRVKKTLDYIGRLDNDKKPDVVCEDELSAEFKGDLKMEAIYNRWEKDFEKYPKRGLTRKKRDAAHIILSSDCENTPENAKKVMTAARETMAQELGDKGYEYVAAMHHDSDNLHVHFVVKCKNRFPGHPKLRLNPKELLQMRINFAKRLSRMGLWHVATLKKDRPDIAVLVRGGVARLTKNERQFQRAMRRAAPTRNAFLYRKNALKTVVRLREQVKERTEPESEKRRELLTALRTIERNIVKNRPGIEKEIAASFRQYSRDFKKMNKFIDQAVNLPKDKATEKKNTNALIRDHYHNLTLNIRLARESIQESDLSSRAKKDSLFVLNQYEKDINKARTQGAFTYKYDKLAFDRSNRHPLAFGHAYAIADRLKPLNDVAKRCAVVGDSKPSGAVEQLKKRRQIEAISKELVIQAATANIFITELNGMDPALKVAALNDLREFEKRMKNRLHGRKDPTEKQSFQKPNMATVLKKVGTLKTYSNCKIEKIGSWIWVSGDTKPIEGKLRKLGFQHSKKKAAWFYSDDKTAARPKQSDKTFSMAELRKMHGSKKLKSKSR